MNEPVLVLNRNFEPLNVCNTRRAVGLLMVGKAELTIDFSNFSIDEKSGIAGDIEDQDQ